jgi:hypothetical protein
MTSVNEKLNSITFIKETFPQLFKIAKKYYCDKSLYANYNFFKQDSHNFSLGDNVDLQLNINLQHPDYYQGNFYIITQEDLNILKNEYCNELSKINNKFSSSEMLQITSTLDTNLFRMESLICKPHLNKKE